MTIAFRIDWKNRYSQTKISRSMFRSRARDRDLRPFWSRSTRSISLSVKQGSELQKKAPVRPSRGLRGAGRSGRYAWPIIGRGAGGIGRRWSVAGNVDTSTIGECRDECQRAKDVFQVDSHGPLILAKKATSLRESFHRWRSDSRLSDEATQLLRSTRCRVLVAEPRGRFVGHSQASGERRTQTAKSGIVSHRTLRRTR
jgi:hypothetical protein